MPAFDNSTVVPSSAFSAVRARTEGNVRPGIRSTLRQTRTYISILFNVFPVCTAVASTVTSDSVTSRRGPEDSSPSGSTLAAMGMVEEIHHEWGYDLDGHWHGSIAEVAPIRKEGETDERDPLAPARGIMWGILISTILWLPVGAAVVLSWKR